MRAKTKIIDTLLHVDFSNMKVPMVVVYHKPRDFRMNYVARVWESSIPAPTNICIVRENLDDIRQDIVKARPNAVCFGRGEDDNECIVESWL